MFTFRDPDGNTIFVVENAWRRRVRPTGAHGAAPGTHLAAPGPEE
jgi:hypothetical protein